MFTTIASFLLLTFPLMVTPGPNNLMLMTSAAKFGIPRTLPHGFGVACGFTFMICVLGLGVAELMTIYPQLEIILKVVAAAYLLWMSYKLLGISLDNEVEVQGRPMRVWEAALFQWINPKAWVIAPSFVAAFVQPGEGRYLSLGLMAIGIFCVSCSTTTVWLVFGERLTAFLKATGTERFLGVILAVLMASAVLMFLFA